MDAFFNGFQKDFGKGEADKLINNFSFFLLFYDFTRLLDWSWVGTHKQAPRSFKQKKTFVIKWVTLTELW